MNKSYIHKLFFSAACFNVIVALPSLLFVGLASQILSLDLDSSAATLFYQITMLIVALFGWVYFKIAGDPVQYRPFILLGILAKSIFVVVIMWHWITGSISWPLAALVSVDLVYAVSFFLVYRRTM